MVLLAGNIEKTSAQQACDPESLSACTIPFTFGSEPSKKCCTDLKAQEPCFCDFIRNPSYEQLITSDKAKKLAANCNVTIPDKKNCTQT
ncbi:hypothetical protein R6Q59_029269 [Mikania micrantha]